MQLITGNTYPVKDQLKALGGKWDPTAKGWKVPDDRAAQARALVVGDSSHSPKAGSYRPGKCQTCGHIELRDSRGYPIGDRILRSGECQSCFEERKMGY
jgi:hypothetical protein